MKLNSGHLGDYVPKKNGIFCFMTFPFPTSWDIEAMAVILCPELETVLKILDPEKNTTDH